MATFLDLERFSPPLSYFFWPLQPHFLTDHFLIKKTCIFPAINILLNLIAGKINFPVVSNARKFKYTIHYSKSGKNCLSSGKIVREFTEGKCYSFSVYFLVFGEENVFVFPVVILSKNLLAGKYFSFSVQFLFLWKEDIMAKSFPASHR